MKKLTIISGAFFISLTLVAILFKILHWKGANFGLLLGMAGLALVFVPLQTRNLLLKKNR